MALDINHKCTPYTNYRLLWALFYVLQALATTYQNTCQLLEEWYKNMNNFIVM